MTDEELIFNELKKNKIILAGDLVRDVSEAKTFFAFVSVERGSGGRQKPTNHRLNQISKEVAASGVFLSFVLVDQGNEDLEGSLKTMLFRFFPTLIRDSFATFDGSRATVWVQPKKILSRDEEKEIEEKTRVFLETLEIRLVSLSSTTSSKTPTQTLVLRTLRQFAPVDAKLLREQLTSKGFVIPSDIWLAKLLDRLRKSGKILRKKNGEFVLTLDGLKALGTAKNRSSADICRALEIAQRKY